MPPTHKKTKKREPLLKKVLLLIGGIVCIAVACDLLYYFYMVDVSSSGEPQSRSNGIHAFQGASSGIIPISMPPT